MLHLDILRNRSAGRHAEEPCSRQGGNEGTEGTSGQTGHGVDLQYLAGEEGCSQGVGGQEPSIVHVVVTADAAGAPVSFRRDLTPREAAGEQRLPLPADVACLADDVGVPLSGWQS